MRLFTFSGIRGSFIGTNPGTGLIKLARAIVDELPAAAKPEYEGVGGVDHFISKVNLSSIVGNPEAIFSLDGAPELDAEGAEFAPGYAAAMVNALKGDDESPVLILAHSQGTNIAAYTLAHLLDGDLDFNAKRPVRIAMFDAKVSPSMVEPLFRRAESFDFLFLQSEFDPLGNQNLGRARKFTDHFPRGNHLWVKGLDHGSIVNPKVMGEEQEVLVRKRYLKLQDDISKARIDVNIPPKALSPASVIDAHIKGVVRRFKGEKARPLDALTGFLRGKLAKQFQS